MSTYVSSTMNEVIAQASREEILAAIHMYYTRSGDTAWCPTLEEYLAGAPRDQLNELVMPLVNEAYNRDSIEVYLGRRKIGGPGIVKDMLAALSPCLYAASITT